MRLISFEHQGTAGYGIVGDGGGVDAGRRLGDRHADLRSVLAAGALAVLHEIEHVTPDLDLAELAVVIGKPGRHIGRESALEHVAGYTCCNEGSVLDYQYHTIQFTAGKNFFRSGSLGPWLLTADKPPIWMRPGDVLEIDIRGLGTLRNTIVDEAAD